MVSRAIVSTAVHFLVSRAHGPTHQGDARDPHHFQCSRAASRSKVLTYYGSTYYGSTYYGSTHYGSTYYGHTYCGHTYELPLTSRGAMLLPPSYMELLVTQVRGKLSV